jgi:hypothetical protein
MISSIVAGVTFFIVGVTTLTTVYLSGSSPDPDISTDIAAELTRLSLEDTPGNPDTSTKDTRWFWQRWGDSLKSVYFGGGSSTTTPDVAELTRTRLSLLEDTPKDTRWFWQKWWDSLKSVYFGGGSSTTTPETSTSETSTRETYTYTRANPLASLYKTQENDYLKLKKGFIENPDSLQRAVDEFDNFKDLIMEKQGYQETKDNSEKPFYIKDMVGAATIIAARIAFGR